MSVITQKLSIGVVTCAMAAAATLTPIPVAQAAPELSTNLGSRAGTLSFDRIFGRSPTNPTPDDPGPLFTFFPDNWYLNGSVEPRPSPTFPLGIPIVKFSPLILVPPGARERYMWFTANLDFKVCAPGISVKLGPYGTKTTSVGKGSCK